MRVQASVTGPVALVLCGGIVAALVTDQSTDQLTERLPDSRWSRLRAHHGVQCGPPVNSRKIVAECWDRQATEKATRINLREVVNTCQVGVWPTIKQLQEVCRTLEVATCADKVALVHRLHTEEIKQTREWRERIHEEQKEQPLADRLNLALVTEV